MSDQASKKSRDTKLTKSDKKIKALKMLQSGKYTKSDISKSIGVARNTLDIWIKDSANKIKQLKVNEKISIWQNESISNLQLAQIARDSLLEDLKVNENVTPAVKNGILHNATVSAGIAWDKSRLESGKDIGQGMSLAIIVRDNVKQLINPDNNDKIIDIESEIEAKTGDSNVSTE